MLEQPEHFDELAGPGRVEVRLEQLLTAYLKHRNLTVVGRDQFAQRVPRCARSSQLDGIELAVPAPQNMSVCWAARLFRYDRVHQCLEPGPQLDELRSIADQFA